MNTKDYKILIDKKGNKYLFKGQDVHTKFGVIKKEDITNKKTVHSNKGYEFRVVPANFFDVYKKIKRGPQIVTPKDIGFVIARTGINKNSAIIDAGGGSGGVSCLLSQFVKKVYCYEIEEKWVNIINENLKLLNINNVEVIKESVVGFKTPEEIEMVFLDLPNTINVLKSDFQGLKKGGYIVCYLPNVGQVKEITSFVEGNDKFILEEVTEITKRDWNMAGIRSRPFNTQLVFTAFLVFIRYY